MFDVYSQWLRHSYACYSLTGEVPYEEYEVADLVGKINGGYRLPIPEGTPNEMYVALKFSSYFSIEQKIGMFSAVKYNACTSTQHILHLA